VFCKTLPRIVHDNELPGEAVDPFHAVALVANE
jgi:hypothetical protein